ncbi:MAG TPA: hypothetical protein VKA46_13225 [Gemmataceae bacterium]|nr:hypothetical protein [Gemmataceae bacterium]
MADATPLSPPSVSAPGKRWWVLLGAVLLPLIYLGTLTTRFDFIDDGNLVYPTRGLPLGQRIAVVWEKIVANYEHLGPFRPVLWCHWELAADLLGGSELGWRITRLVWCGLATLMLLGLFAELRLAPWAALFAAAVAMWNPYRNEIWTSLTLSEGVAMPYALLALVCACRAPRSRFPWAWDVLGACCVLAALGCKNTFAALVPAQMFLRLAPDQWPLREGWRRHGPRALLLSATLLAPLAHFVYFKRHWHPGQYTTDGATLGQLRRIVSSLFGAVSADFVGLGLLLAVVAQLVARRRGAAWLTDILDRHRAALGAGALLLVGGVVLYLPVGTMSGRYSMPAVWGLDLIVALLLSGLTGLRSNWSRIAWGALALGLAGVMVASVGKQQKFAARARLLWEALEYVERQAPPSALVAWVSGDSLKDGLNVEEGIHFQWHLAARGRGDVRVSLFDELGRPQQRSEMAAAEEPPAFAISGLPQSPGAGDWQVERRFAVACWGGLRRSECYLLRSADGAPRAATEKVAVGTSRQPLPR